MTPDMAAITTEINVGGYNVDKSTIAYIKEASRVTGVSLEYMLAKAGQESSFSKNASSDKSSAKGIYQFTVSTWLQQFKLHGHKYGHKKLANKIKRNRRGRYYVKDKTTRQIILNLRNDPRTSAMLAAEYAKSNLRIIESEFNRKASASDLYLAHFLGPVGAIKLLNAEKRNKWQSAVKLFKEAAIANPKIFYKADKKTHKSVEEVHKMLNKLFSRALKRFTNLPPHIFASLPELLPTGKPSISGPSLNPLVAPIRSSNTQKLTLPDIEEEWFRINLSENKYIEEDFDIKNSYSNATIKNIDQINFNQIENVINLDEEDSLTPAPNFSQKIAHKIIPSPFSINEVITKAPEPKIKNVSVAKILEKKNKKIKREKIKKKKISTSIAKIITQGQEKLEKAYIKKKKLKKIKTVSSTKQNKKNKLSFREKAVGKLENNYKAPKNIITNIGKHVISNQKNKFVYNKIKFVSIIEEINQNKKEKNLFNNKISYFEETAFYKKNYKSNININDVLAISELENDYTSHKNKKTNFIQVAYISAIETDDFNIKNKSKIALKDKNKIKQETLTNKEKIDKFEIKTINSTYNKNSLKKEFIEIAGLFDEFLSYNKKIEELENGQ